MWNLDFRETTTDVNKNDISMKAGPRKRRWSGLDQDEGTAASGTRSPPPATSPALTAGDLQAPVKGEHFVCAECVQRITDQFVLRMSERWWHARCLRCSVCQVALDAEPSCFMRDDQLYCRADYAKMFGPQCSKCCRAISASDWVRKARDLVYHLACFACDACHRQLSSGEEFALHENRVLCKTHYMETLDLGSTSSDGWASNCSSASGQSVDLKSGCFISKTTANDVTDGGDSEGYHKNKAKRVRTTFTEEQLQVLQANFHMDSNPDGQDLERIAQMTGLSKRVVQVWFQNARARQKKTLHNHKIKSQGHHPSSHLTRDSGMAVGDSAFGSHINLHLTYSFSQQHGKPPPNTQPQALFTTHPDHAPSEASSMDELSQDSMLHCMRGEV